MVGIAVAMIVLSTAAMKTAMRAAMRTQPRRVRGAVSDAAVGVSSGMPAPSPKGGDHVILRDPLQTALAHASVAALAVGRSARQDSAAAEDRERGTVRGT